MHGLRPENIKTWSVAQTGKCCRNSKRRGIPEDLGEDDGLPGRLNLALKENSVGRKAKAEKYGMLCSGPGRDLCIA